MVENVRKKNQDVSLKDVYIIGVQHLVRSTLRMFSSLFQQGLPQDHLFLLGKCYSTNPAVFEEMNRRNIHTDRNSLYFNSHESFDDSFFQVINGFIEESLPLIIERCPKKIIILDDGGSLLTRLQKNISSIKNCQLVGIEQTTSGFRALKQTRLNVPIINVARSKTKLIYESPLIARSAIRTIMNHLKRLSIVPQQVLIIGKGAIGKSIQRTLRQINFHEVFFYDTERSKSCFMPEMLQQHLSQFDLILGCTGATSLGPELYPFLKKGAVLASISSSDREFNAVALRKQLPVTFNCHEDLLVDSFYLLNCGFPINFDSDFESVDSDEYELTRSLLSQAIFQAALLSPATRNYMIPLNTIIQKEITQKFQTRHPRFKDAF
jgi:S-adenosylhomocysteine hydrolase